MQGEKSCFINRRESYFYQQNFSWTPIHLMNDFLHLPGIRPIFSKTQISRNSFLAVNNFFTLVSVRSFIFL